MRLKEFLRVAEREFRAVPEEFRRGVAGPVVERKAKRHAYLAGYYTLGQCLPVSTMFTLGEEHLSTVFLYYGSFVACAMRDEGFKIEEEVRETIRHEIRHHLEDRAGAPDLRNEDAAEEQNERRLQGLPFAPAFYRLGEREGDALWRVHPDLFLEIPLNRRALAKARADGLAVRWAGKPHRIEPDELETLPAYLPLEGVEVEDAEGGPGEVVVVVREE
jgi:hypothetical protein